MQMDTQLKHVLVVFSFTTADTETTAGVGGGDSIIFLSYSAPHFRFIRLIFALYVVRMYTLKTSMYSITAKREKKEETFKEQQILLKKGWKTLNN